MRRAYAVICPSSSRYAGWVAGLGCDHLPLLSIEPVTLEAADGGPGEPHYLADFGALPGEARERIARDSAALYGVTAAEVAAEFEGWGMPVRAADVVTCVDPDEGRSRLPFWAGATPEGGRHAS